MPHNHGFQAWRAQHGSKRRYASPRDARRARRWYMLRYLDGHLNVYQCRWTSRWKDGPYAGTTHWHLGHRRRNRTWARAYIIWPYYRARLWARRRWHARRE